MLFAKDGGDPPDASPSEGRFFWNELHTTNPKAALAFYGAVVRYASRSLDMGGAGAYHILSHDGVDRFGVFTDPTGAVLAVMKPAS